VIQWDLRAWYKSGSRRPCRDCSIARPLSATVLSCWGMWWWTCQSPSCWMILCLDRLDLPYWPGANGLFVLVRICLTQPTYPSCTLGATGGHAWNRAVGRTGAIEWPSDLSRAPLTGAVSTLRATGAPLAWAVLRTIGHAARLVIFASHPPATSTHFEYLLCAQVVLFTLRFDPDAEVQIHLSRTRCRRFPSQPSVKCCQSLTQPSRFGRLSLLFLSPPS